MNLGLITYNKKHRKTQEVLRGLRKRNFKNITLLISNFKKLKKDKFYLIIDQSSS